MQGGGVLIDSGINTISLLLSIVGPLTPTKVSFGQVRNTEVEDVVDCSFVHAIDPSVKGTLHYNWLSSEPEASLYTFVFESEARVHFLYRFSNNFLF